MITLLELHYNIQKGLFFSDKIVTETYTIYHCTDQKSAYCNYAIISDLTSAKKSLGAISEDFAKLERQPCIYINATQINDLNELQEQKIQVRYTESWLRYDGVEIEEVHPVKIVDADNIEDYMEVYSKPENNFAFKVTPEYLKGVRKCLASPNFYSFIAYDGRRPVSTVSLGVYNGYCMIYGLVTNKEDRGRGYTQSVLSACIKKFKEINGKEIYVLQPSNSYLEKWYVQHGFKKILTGYGMY